MEQSNFKILSRPQVIENSRQYLLLRTDILQKTREEEPSVMCGCAGDWADVALNYGIVFKGNFDPAKDRVQYIS